MTQLVECVSSMNEAWVRSQHYIELEVLVYSLQSQHLEDGGKILRSYIEFETLPQIHEGISACT